MFFFLSLGYLIIKSLDLKISNVSISSLSNNYGIASTVLTTLFFQDDYRKSRAEVYGYYDQRDAVNASCFNPSGFRYVCVLTLLCVRLYVMLSVWY